MLPAAIRASFVPGELMGAAIVKFAAALEPAANVKAPPDPGFTEAARVRGPDWLARKMLPGVAPVVVNVPLTPLVVAPDATLKVVALADERTMLPPAPVPTPLAEKLPFIRLLAPNKEMVAPLPFVPKGPATRFPGVTTRLPVVTIITLPPSPAVEPPLPPVADILRLVAALPTVMLLDEPVIFTVPPLPAPTALAFKFKTPALTVSPVPLILI
jgi:hypothetical protein